MASYSLWLTPMNTHIYMTSHTPNYSQSKQWEDKKACVFRLVSAPQ